MAKNPRQANGSARKKLRNRLKAEGRECWICKAFGRPARIDYDLPPGQPGSFEVDELIPVSRYREGGYTSPQACALDYGNLASVHRACNQWRGNKSVAQVMAIAKGGGNGKRHAGARGRLSPNMARALGMDDGLPQPWEF